jgi:vacuolar-type H+-ATPase subunit E/Vma4
MNHVQEYIENFFAKLVDEVENETESPLKAYAAFNQAIEFIEQCKDQIKPIAIRAAERMGEKTFTSDGIKFELREGRSNWDYKSCQRWNEKKAELAEIEAELKANAEAAQRSMSQLITADGEVLEYATRTFSAPSLIIKK